MHANLIGIETNSTPIRSFLFIGLFFYLLILALIVSFSEHQLIGMLLAPLPLFFFRINSTNMLILYFACNLFFFPSSWDGANFYFMQISDAVLIAYLVCYYIKKEDFFSFVLPRNSMVLVLYVFLFFIMIRAIGPLLGKGYDIWLFYDIKKYLVFMLAAFFCTQQIFGPKKIVTILFAIIFFTVLHSLTAVISFFFTQERQLTWNEIYFGNIPIVCLVLLTVVKKVRYKIFLTISALLSLLAMLSTQTRSIWIATTICIVSFLFYQFFIKMKKVEVQEVVKTLLLTVIMVVIIQILMQVFLGTDLWTFLIKRLTSFKSGDPINPFSSIGYRFYESYCVLLHRTFWGHGTGAYLFIFETQGKGYKWVNWWSIHSEYMEVIHKWGIFGLGLYLVFLGFILKQSFQLLLSKKKFIAAMGAIAFFTIVNTLIISITSGYFFRVNMIMFDVIIVGIVANYYYRLRRIKAIRRRRPA
jgi:hypothetical protein